MTMPPYPPENSAEAGGPLLNALGKAEQVTSALNRFAEIFSASIRAAQAPDLWDERIAALEERLGARIAEAMAEKTIPARPEPPASAIFMAQKAGLERLLIGFRITLSNYSQQMEQMAAMQPATPDLAPLLERLDRLEARLEENARLAAPQAAPPHLIAQEDAARDLPLFSAEQAVSHRAQVGMRLLLRQFGVYSEGLRMATERLNQRVRDLEEAGPVPSLAETAPPVFDLSPVLARLEAIEQRLEASPASPGSMRDLPAISESTLAEKVRQEQQGRQIHQLSMGLQLLGQSVMAELSGVRATLETLAERTEAGIPPGPARAAPDTETMPAMAALRPTLEKTVVGFQMLLRRLDEGVNRLDSATRALEGPPGVDAFGEAIAGLSAGLENLTARVESLPAAVPDLSVIAEALRERYSEMQSGMAIPVMDQSRLAASFLDAVQRTEGICLQLGEAVRGLRPARQGAQRMNADEEARALQGAAQVITAQTAEFLAIAAAVSKEVSAWAQPPGKERAG